METAYRLLCPYFPPVFFQEPSSLFICFPTSAPINLSNFLMMKPNQLLVINWELNQIQILVI